MTRVLYSVAAVATLAFLSHIAFPTANAQAKVLGWAEWALVSKHKIRMRAKLDTGARSSSVHAEDVERFRRGGKDWVRFTLRSRSGKSAKLELEVHRWVRIRRAGVRTRQRAVVLIGICLGTIHRMAQVNLSSRDRMNYALLIGRRFLGDKIVVDSSRRYTTPPDC